MQHKIGLETAATTGSEGSYWSLLNPISSITGGVDRYPEFMADIFPSSPRTAWLVSKIGAQALLGLAVAGATRYARHMDTVEKITSSDLPVGKATKQIGATFTAPLTGQKKSENDKAEKGANKENKQKKTAKTSGTAHVYQAPEASEVIENTMNAALPTAALMLGLAGGYALVDKYAIKTKREKLSEAIAAKRKILGDLISTRARIAKGTATDDEVETVLAATADVEAFTKDACYGMSKTASDFLRSVVGSAGLLATALLTGSAIASYVYFSKSHPDNLEYEATEDGVAAYMKAKGNMTPITVIPRDLSTFLSRIDEPRKEESGTAATTRTSAAAPGHAPVAVAAPAPSMQSEAATEPAATAELPGQEMRSLPEHEATRKPISITL